MLKKSPCQSDEEFEECQNGASCLKCNVIVSVGMLSKGQERARIMQRLFVSPGEHTRKAILEKHQRRLRKSDLKASTKEKKCCQGMQLLRTCREEVLQETKARLTWNVHFLLLSKSCLGWALGFSVALLWQKLWKKCDGNFKWGLGPKFLIFFKALCSSPRLINMLYSYEKMTFQGKMSFLAFKWVLPSLG